MKRYLIQIVIVTIGLSLFLFSQGNTQFVKKPKLPKKDIVQKSKTEEVDVDDVLLRIKKIKLSFQGATESIKNSRKILFDIAATNQQKEQIKAMLKDEAAAASDEEKERIVIKREAQMDSVILNALKKGELENKRLNTRQLENASKLSFNISLAILLDKLALDDSPQIISDGKTIAENPPRDPKVFGKIKEISEAVNKDIPDIHKEIPMQLETLESFSSAITALKKNNDIDISTPTADSKFEKFESENAIQ